MNVQMKHGRMHLFSLDAGESHEAREFWEDGICKVSRAFAEVGLTCRNLEMAFVVLLHLRPVFWGFVPLASLSEIVKFFWF